VSLAALADVDIMKERPAAAAAGKHDWHSCAGRTLDCRGDRQGHMPSPGSSDDDSVCVAALPTQEIRLMMELAWATPGAVHLEVGEPDFTTPAVACRAAAEAVKRGATRYTPNAGIAPLRRALARKLQNDNGYRVDPEQIIVTNGGIEALYVTFLALLGRGDEVLLPDPGWPNFQSIAHLVGARTIRYPLRADDGYRPRLEDLDRLASNRTRALVLVSPSNPVGSVLDRADIERVAAWASDHHVWLIADECYDGITFDDRFVSVAAVTGPDQVVSVYSFSKTYAMTGWRVGYAVVPGDHADLVSRMQEPIISCVNAPAQHAALAVLTDARADAEAMRRAYRDRRDHALALLADGGLPAFKPSGAFYVWVDISSCGLPSFSFARRLLETSRVAVAPGSAFGPASDGFIRISLAASETDIATGIKAVCNLARADG
jgi:aspartate aminotransferase